MSPPASAEPAPADTFSLYPRLLRLLPTTITPRTSSPLPSLYPALISAGAADARLSALGRVAPLLTHVAAAAASAPDESVAAHTSAAAVLLTALSERAPAEATAFLVDVGKLLGVARAGGVGRVCVFEGFGCSVRDGGEGGKEDDGGVWPERKIFLECYEGTEEAVVRLLRALVCCPAWVRVGARGRNEVVREVLASAGAGGWKVERGRGTGYVGLLEGFLDVVRSGVALGRSIKLRVASARAEFLAGAEEKKNSVAMENHQRQIQTQRNGFVESGSRESVLEVTPPARKRRRVAGITTPGTGGRVEGALRSVASAGEEVGPEVCAKVSKMCAAVLKAGEEGLGGDAGSLALEVGARLLGEAVDGRTGKVAPAFRGHGLALLELAAVLLEVAAVAQVRALRRYDTEVTIAACSTATAAPTALPASAKLTENMSGAFGVGRGGRSGDRSMFLPHPSDSTAFLTAAEKILVLLGAVPSSFTDEFASAESCGGVDRNDVLKRAAVVLWRISDLHYAFTVTGGLADMLARALLPVRHSATRQANLMHDGDDDDDDDDDEHALRNADSDEGIERLEVIARNLVSVAAVFESQGFAQKALLLSGTTEALLRASNRILSRDVSDGASTAVEAAASRLEDLVRSHLAGDQPELAAGGLLALADLVCACSSCRTCILVTDSPLGDARGVGAGNVPQACGDAVWNLLFRLVEPLVQGTGHDRVIGAATRVTGRLVFHAPDGKVGRAGAELVQAVWHPFSLSAREEAAFALSRVFALSGAWEDANPGIHARQNRNVAGEPGRSFSGAQTPDESEDDREMMSNAEKNFPTGLTSISKLMGTELQSQLSKASDSDGNLPTVFSMSLSLLAKMSNPSAAVGGGGLTKVLSRAREALLSAAVADQRRMRGILYRTPVSTSNYSAPGLCSWTELLFASSEVDGIARSNPGTDHFFAVSRELVGGRPRVIAAVLNQTTKRSISEVLSRFLISRYKEWLPIALSKLLSDDGYTSQLITILNEPHLKSFWDKVPRFALGTVLRDGNRATLESLALRVESPIRDLVDRVCADAIAREALFTKDVFLADEENKCIELIQSVMEVPICEVIDSRLGKVVRRIVMEFGDRNSATVKHALLQVSSVLSSNRSLLNWTERSMSAEQMVVQNFLLVMDAVNRGLFSTWAASSERLRCLLILDSVLGLCRKSLHMFIPKVMATLKMALNITGVDRSFRDDVCRVWVTFMNALGPSRLGPRLGQVISILAPFLAHHHRVFAPTLCNIFVNHRADISSYFPGIALLVTTIAHPSLAPVGNVLREELGEDEASGLNGDGRSGYGQGSNGIFDTDKYAATLSEVLSQATTHDSAAIRCLALDHMLLKLRERRGWLLSSLTVADEDASCRTKRTLLRRLVHGFSSLLLHADWNVREKAIRCLGEIGAVDPVRLGDVSLSSSTGAPSSSAKKRRLPLSVRNLAADLLSDYLVPALHRGGDLLSSGNRLNRVGMAIQELLRVCGCSEGTPSKASAIRAAIDEGMRRYDLSDWELKISERFAGDNLSADNELAAHFWGRLPVEVQQAAQPYLSCPFDTSAYVGSLFGPDELFADKALKTLRARGEIWKRIAAGSSGDGDSEMAAEWRVQMTAQMTDFIGRRGKFGALFAALRPILRHDDRISSHLLPLVIVEYLDFAPVGHNPNAGVMTESDSPSFLFNFLLSEVTDALVAGGEAAQSVFLLLDTLRQWRGTRASLAAKALLQAERRRIVGADAGSRKRAAALNENEFSENAVRTDVLTPLVDLEGRSRLSLMVLAHAAHKCRAYSRAVLYAEQHIQNIRRIGGLAAWPAFVKEMIGRSRDDSFDEASGEGVIDVDDDNEDDKRHAVGHDSDCGVTAKSVATLRKHESEADALALMQVCFAELEDADAMAGVAALRQDTSLTETILDAEASGSFDDALLGYERALALNPNDTSLHAGFLRCLRTLGHWETMLAHAEGLGRVSATSSLGVGPGGDPTQRSVYSLGMEAAWRLGRWDRVDEIAGEASIASLPFRMSEDDHRTGGLVTSVASSTAPGALGGKVNLGDGNDWEAVYGLAVGEMLSCVRRKNSDAIKELSCRARSSLLAPASSAAMEGYARAYPLVVKLHSLADIEDTIVAVCANNLSGRNDTGNRAGSPADNLATGETSSLVHPDLRSRLVGMNARSAATSCSLNVREPILSCRRVCLELLECKSEAAVVSLQLAELARESGNLRAASSAAFRAMSTVPPRSDEWFAASTEIARIQAARGDKTGALLSLEKDIDRMSSLLRRNVNASAEPSLSISGAGAIAAKQRLASAHVLAGKWIEEARSAPTEEVVKHFRKAASYAPNKGESFYALGRFYDTLLQNPSNTTAGRAHHVPFVLGNFTDALLLGHDYLFEILPRLLTICFDFFSKVESKQGIGSSKPISPDVVKRTQRYYKRALVQLPKYMWMTVLPQLMSRVLHPNVFARKALHELLASIFVQFPNECVWMIAPSSQLADKERKAAGGDILNQAVSIARRPLEGSRSLAEAKALSSKLKTTARNGLQMVKHLIGVCQTESPKEKRGRADNAAKEFARMRSELKNYSVIIPTLAALTVTLPVEGHRHDRQSHRPFAPCPITIVDVETTVLVMASLMRPRRIGFMGSDGERYRFLAKRETAGDMRKDSRLIDFLTVVNRLLAKDAEARRRDLRIKTYAVLPLTEETGMIEWVNDIEPLRTVVRNEQARLGNVPDAQSVLTRHQTMTKRRFLEDWGVPRHPAVLDKFFLRQFGSDPQAWLAARNTWIRSVAAWSMTGFIVGLGDRHGENLLIERTTGMCVHVDFAMLFDKGLTLKVPEIVPFRLTHNMVVAMGVAGYEGTFRIVSEIVMGVLRGNADALMGVLESFLHDPMADWTKAKSRSSGSTHIRNNEEANGDVGNNVFATDMRRGVEKKLRGMFGNGNEGELPLSIEGQVQRLILEATSPANLSEMYIWWGAWGT